MTSLTDVASYLSPEPRAPIPAADMVERAVHPLRERHGDRAIRAIDALFVHAPPATGTPADVADVNDVVRRLGVTPEWFLDLRNGGGAAFVHMLKLARQLMTAGQARTALICTLHEGACGVGYLTATAESPLLAVECRHVLDGDERSLPAEVLAVCGQIGVPRDAIDVLVTNQPSRALLRTWREALSLAGERHLDTLAEHGDLSAAALPVALERGIAEGRVKDGDLVVLAGYARPRAHVGCVGAAAFRFRAFTT